jgi:hypothetical protein
MDSIDFRPAARAPAGLGGSVLTGGDPASTARRR